MSLQPQEKYFLTDPAEHETFKVFDQPASGNAARHSSEQTRRRNAEAEGLDKKHSVR